MNRRRFLKYAGVALLGGFSARYLPNRSVAEPASESPVVSQIEVQSSKLRMVFESPLVLSEREYRPVKPSQPSHPLNWQYEEREMYVSGISVTARGGDQVAKETTLYQSESGESIVESPSADSQPRMAEVDVADGFSGEATLAIQCEQVDGDFSTTSKLVVQPG